MVRIEINELDGKVNTKQVISKSSGEVLTFREQTAYIYNGGIYPEKIIVQLDKDDAPYPAGFYTLDDSSYSVGDFGALKIKRIKLVPVK
ncbi:G5P family DNA-binding protein [Photorhabdus temperata]|uniref:Single-stranded DNA-binding protein n=1 Tax=Photorhabdus temperata subsp. temperata Meg1 TaxID=1393735 RepID=A0A081RV89_PHOTE|nr:single-stranded DNA-binding protein [Photorhabdus temperata]KER02592.1 Helix-destabilising protein [Photorhabdus temperata subsp. temperata Meg1]MCT8347987.1 G5P family DNA-binding protein [Photorhabdus temperata]